MSDKENQKITKRLLFPKLSYPEEDTENHISHMLKSFRTKPDYVLLKFIPDPHRLSKELQTFYIQITEGTFGYNEYARNYALKLLTTNYSVKFLAPYLAEFIKQSIHLNLAFQDLTLLIYSVRMAKDLMSNPYVEVKYILHELIPAILSCVLARQISKYHYDNHWTLRDYSTYVIASICHKYGNRINQIKPRVTNIYMRCLFDENVSFASLYGAVKGLISLGEDAIRRHLFPNLSEIGRKVLKSVEYRNYNLDYKKQTLESKRIRDMIVNDISLFLLKTKVISIDINNFIKEFGYFGHLLFMEIKNLEKIESKKVQSNILLNKTA